MWYNITMRGKEPNGEDYREEMDFNAPSEEEAIELAKDYTRKEGRTDTTYEVIVLGRRNYD